MPWPRPPADPRLSTREAILEHLEHLEDVYLAEQRLIDIRAGRTKTIPLDDVMKQYGLED
jgi:RHH-type rel operon transcriptional repressor/antitoxin RelB